MEQPRNLKGQFASRRDGSEEQEQRAELEQAQDYREYRELREPRIASNEGISGSLYRHYGHYQF